MSFAMQNYYKYFNVASDINIFLTKVHLFLKYYMFFAILSLRNIEGAIPKIHKGLATCDLSVVLGLIMQAY